MSESMPPLQPATPVAAPSSTRSWEVLCHMSSILGFVLPFGNIIGPLIVWLAKRNDGLGIDAHGKESLNFQISWTLYGTILAAIMFILLFVLIGLLIIPILFIGWVAMVVLTVIASVKASNGELYRYPLTIRFLQ